MALPTIKQKLTFRNLLEAIEIGKSWDLKSLMVQGGYSIATAKNPAKNLIIKEGFQQLLGQIDDRMILAKIYEVLFAGDKDSTLKAADMLLKLKDKYPDQKTKVSGLFGILNNIKENGEEKEETQRHKEE